MINILGLFAKEVKVLSPDKNEYTIIVPEPAVYVIQKILTNPTRKPPEKKQKDIAAVKELLYHIEKSPEHLMKLQEVYASLSKKQLKILKQVCVENNIITFEGI